MLFDDDDETELPDEAIAWSRKLVVLETFATGEELNEREEAWRAGSKVPVVFEDEDGVVENAAQMASAMALPPGTVPTAGDVDLWLYQQWAAR